ncbi:MAG TPA: nuclear transport factor 2 family protein [Gemmatimonadales bacterium]|nr:nuclear transport factor 2 family protein [Gemmatimonadales bacterium]
MAEQLSENFMRAVQHAELTGELDSLLALFRDDAEALNLGRTEPAQGKDELREFWQAYLSAFREIRSEFIHVLDADSGSVLEWVSQGTLPDGSPIEYRGVSVLEVEGDKVRKFRTYYDSAVFLPQGAKA